FRLLPDRAPARARARHGTHGRWGGTMGAQLPVVEAGPKQNPERSQWFTPPEIAREMVRMVAQFLRMRPDARILEPSAGRGNLVRAMLELSSGFARIDAVELDARWQGSLEGLGDNVRVEICDYLERPA